MEIPDVIKEKKICPAGKVLRKSYTRRYKNSVLQRGYSATRKGKKYIIKPEARNVYVRSSCVNKKKQKKPTANITSHLRRTDLQKHGYMFYKEDTDRRRALIRAIRQYGIRKVYNHLDSAARTYSSSYPAASKTFKADRKWVRNEYSKIAKIIEP